MRTLLKIEEHDLLVTREAFKDADGKLLSETITCETATVIPDNVVYLPLASNNEAH